MNSFLYNYLIYLEPPIEKIILFPTPQLYPLYHKSIGIFVWVCFWLKHCANCLYHGLQFFSLWFLLLQYFNLNSSHHLQVDAYKISPSSSSFLQPKHCLSQARVCLKQKFLLSSLTYLKNKALKELKSNTLPENDNNSERI